MLSIMANSLRLTLQELKVNKTRTALSLTGVAFGIFCIIGVLATVGSLEQNIQNDVNSLGSNTIYIDKWDYSGGPDKPWWKMRARPVMKYEEARMIKERSDLTLDIAFLLQTGGNIVHGNDQMQNVSVYGITEAQISIQPITFETGRYFSQMEFNSGTNVCILGFENAESLFGEADRAEGKQVEIKGRRVTVVGVIKKQGKSFIGWNYDNCIMLPYNFCRQVYDEKNSNPVLIAKGKPGVSTDAFYQELRGIMRQIRRLSPTEEDDFSLNSVEAFSKAISGFFGLLDWIGGFIGVISLIVGLFGIANIMFVTVKERTSVIGLKKAIGAKRSSILFEFLVEASLLCIMGGIVGLFLVWVGTLILTHFANFPIFISVPLLLATFIICIVVGILAGIIPARRAAKLDPVVAIRS